MSVEDIKHLAFVLVHGGLEPEQGFGGCSCKLCSLIRGEAAVIRKREVAEYMKGKP